MFYGLSTGDRLEPYIDLEGFEMKVDGGVQHTLLNALDSLDELLGYFFAFSVDVTLGYHFLLAMKLCSIATIIIYIFTIIIFYHQTTTTRYFCRLLMMGLTIDINTY